jgi:hypothetical protein
MPALKGIEVTRHGADERQGLRLTFTLRDYLHHRATADLWRALEAKTKHQVPLSPFVSTFLFWYHNGVL